MSYNTTHIINPKPCAYWSSYSNLLEYFSKETLEFFLQKKHICPNCGQKSATTTITPLPLTTPKPSNSFELFITSPKAKIQNSLRGSLICLTEQRERVRGSKR